MIIDELAARRKNHGEAAPSYFHKTGPGQYQEKDVFWEIATPALREVLNAHPDADREEIESLLQSPVHEARACALSLLCRKFRRSDFAGKTEIHRYYLSRLDRVNGWDLVDISAPEIVGNYVGETHDESVLDELVLSPDLWRRRVAIVSTWALIGKGSLDATFRITEKLMKDEEDLIHKACGWMLREAGKQDRGRLNRFLREHYSELSRTTLRYAIERHEETERKNILKGIFQEE